MLVTSEVVDDVTGLDVPVGLAGAVGLPGRPHAAVDTATTIKRTASDRRGSLWSRRIDVFMDISLHPAQPSPEPSCTVWTLRWLLGGVPAHALVGKGTNAAAVSCGAYTRKPRTGVGRQSATS